MSLSAVLGRRKGMGVHPRAAWVPTYEEPCKKLRRALFPVRNVWEDGRGTPAEEGPSRGAPPGYNVAGAISIVL